MGLKVRDGTSLLPGIRITELSPKGPTHKSIPNQAGSGAARWAQASLWRQNGENNRTRPVAFSLLHLLCVPILLLHGTNPHFGHTCSHHRTHPWLRRSAQVHVEEEKKQKFKGKIHFYPQPSCQGIVPLPFSPRNASGTPWPAPRSTGKHQQHRAGRDGLISPEIPAGFVHSSACFPTGSSRSCHLRNLLSSVPCLR